MGTRQKKKICNCTVVCLSQVGHATVVRQSYDNRELFGAFFQVFMYWDARWTVVLLSCNCDTIDDSQQKLLKHARLHPYESNKITGRFPFQLLHQCTILPKHQAPFDPWLNPPMSGVSILVTGTSSRVRQGAYSTGPNIIVLVKKPSSLNGMFFQTFIPAELYSSKKIVKCRTTNVPLSYDKQSMLCEHRTKFVILETIVRLYHECLAIVVRLSYDSPATIVLSKWFMLVPTMMCLSHNSRTTVVRHSHDNHNTVIRQKVVEQKRCMSNFRSTTHNSATMLKISCNCRAIVVRRSQMTHDLTKFHVVEL